MNRPLIRPRSAVLMLAALACSLATGLAPARAEHWEVQGELQLTEILDKLERVVLEHASSHEEFATTMNEIGEAMRSAVQEMRESEPGSPRFRLAKSDWAELMSRKVGNKMAWAANNVGRSREIVSMIEQALGLITQLLSEMAEEPATQGEYDRVRRDMVRLGAQIGMVLHEATAEWDSRTQASLRSVMIGLTQLEEDRYGSGQEATFGVYVRLKNQLQTLLEATGDLLARNRVQVARNRVDAERLEAMIIRDLASMNVARLEEYTRLLTSPGFLLGSDDGLFSNADDFAEIEEMEARERANERPASHAVDTRDGFARLMRGGTRR